MPTILLIDDSQLVLEITQEMLQELNYLVLATSDPDEFMRLLQTMPHPQLAIVDAVMPYVSGDQLIGKVRSMTDPQLSQLPIIMATALADQEPKGEGVLILNKPFTLGELQRTLDFALG